MLRRRMHKLRAEFRTHAGFPDSRNLMHKLVHKNSLGGRIIMTSTIVWTGVGVWVGLNVALVALRLYVTRPEKMLEPVPVWNRQFG
jgi:hypothetical protein